MTSSAIDVFDKWAQNGKDEGMKRNHLSSYQYIKSIIHNQYHHSQNLKLADVGCGNGWASGDLLEEKYIKKVCGYDGANKMIEKAKKTIKGPSFFNMDLNNWEPGQKFDIIYSMEVIYYLDQPNQFIDRCYKNWLNPNGLFIAGIDHYQENESSLSWAEDLNVNMKTKTINEWKEALITNQFVDTGAMQVNQKEGWSGTLIFWGKKNDL